MPQWGKEDNAANSVIWAPAQYKVAPTRAAANSMYANSTANAVISGLTVGMYAVDATEMAVNGGDVAHTGWVVRTVGQGGRAGRVQTEVLVAGGIASSNSADNTVFPDA